MKGVNWESPSLKRPNCQRQWAWRLCEESRSQQKEAFLLLTPRAGKCLSVISNTFSIIQIQVIAQTLGLPGRRLIVEETFLCLHRGSACSGPLSRTLTSLEPKLHSTFTSLHPPQPELHKNNLHFCRTEHLLTVFFVDKPNTPAIKARMTVR